MKLQGERFLGFIQGCVCVGGGGGGITRFNVFFIILINGKKEKDGFKIFMRGSSYGRTLLRSFASC